MKIGYMRVSDCDQTEALQLDALRAENCDLIFGDHGVSGSEVVREGLENVLTKLQPGDTLVVWKLDRLGRSTIHLLLLLDELRQRNVDFVAITQGIDTSSAAGRMMYGQLALFAEFEREQIRERTKAGMAAAKKRGVHVGRPPKLSDDQITAAVRQIEKRNKSVSAVARRFGVSGTTLARAIRARGQQA